MHFLIASYVKEVTVCVEGSRTPPRTVQGICQYYDRSIKIWAFIIIPKCHSAMNLTKIGSPKLILLVLQSFVN